MQRIIEELKKLYIEGQRYYVLSAFIGSMAKLGIDKSVVYDIYNEIKHLDDEDRSHLIERTYERYNSRQSIMTLSSIKEFGTDNLYKAIKQTFKGNTDTLTSFDINTLSDKLSKPKKENKISHIDYYNLSTKIDRQLTPDAYQYLRKRKITDENIEKYKIRLGLGSYKDYILFPVFDENDNCVFFTGRNYKGGTPRYKNYYTNSDNIIWLSDKEYDKKTIIVCEGIINAITIRNYTNMLTCSVFGKYLQSKKLSFLNQFETVILSFDSDVSFDFLYNRIYKRLPDVKKVFYIRYPKGIDANDLTEEQFLKLFLNRKEINDAEYLKQKMEGLNVRS